MISKKLTKFLILGVSIASILTLSTTSFGSSKKPTPRPGNYIAGGVPRTLPSGLRVSGGPIVFGPAVPLPTQTLPK
ncbi:MAG: hypothetical protein SFT68_01570 [Rickettsiaceae bacterium]|nr:hypothetical protein [Rickettsiaceae bacterium]